LDTELLEGFRKLVLEKMPYPKDSVIVNPTPMIDLSDVLYHCALEEYSISLKTGFKVYGKFESTLPGGSIKTRPAVSIVEDAIAKGRLKKGSYIFEATSGNFGISLGLLTSLGFKVFTVVSRKLQDGVLKSLAESGVNVIQLDMDICPAPGLKTDFNILTAKLLADKLATELKMNGLPTEPFERERNEIEKLLAREDMIELVKKLAEIYDGFCPEQYDNNLNPEVHERITAFEIEQQLHANGFEPPSFEIVCAFGTGGTSLGLSKFFINKYGKKLVRVVYPLEGQDVAGIRTKEKAVGLAFYKPDLYLGEHVVDFEQAKKLLNYFVSRGIGIGESGALVLYAIIQMLNFGVGKNFVAIIADGMEKYKVSTKQTQQTLSVKIDEVKMNPANYSNFVWTHTLFTPKEEALEIISSSLGISKESLRVVRTSDVTELLSSSKLPKSVQDILPKGGNILLICMAGGTSLSVAKILKRLGYSASSLEGGLIALAQEKGIKPQSLVQVSSG
jgi:cysteine synthase/rhodanese-related sulfurtransferase